MDYKFHINDFEGPLDLLLHLVRQSKMDLYEMSLTTIIDQYIEFIKEMKHLDMDIASEYLVMASELVHLKSKMLIHEEDEEEEDSPFEMNSEEDLRNKLIEYEAIKNVTSSFKELEEKRSEVYTKLPESLKEYYEQQKIEKGMMDPNDLYEAFLNIQKRLELQKPLHTKITKREISVEERTQEIKELLKKEKKLDFYSLFDTPTKEYVVVTFLTILTMSKNKELKITQEKAFGTITVEGVEA